LSKKKIGRLHKKRTFIYVKKPMKKGNKTMEKFSYSSKNRLVMRKNRHGFEMVKKYNLFKDAIFASKTAKMFKL